MKKENVDIEKLTQKEMDIFWNRVKDHEKTGTKK